jgi:adenylate cyclase
VREGGPGRGAGAILVAPAQQWRGVLRERGAKRARPPRSISMNCPACGLDNPQYHRFCSACGAALGGAPRGESERKLATVLFADMSGFTALSEQLDPEEIYEINNIFLQELAAAVHRYGGTVDKYIGDEIMALFGAPRAHEDDPERALATALEMREGVRAVNERLGARLPRPIELHAGVNTGLVIAGRVGDTSRSDYTAIGDTVNLAARLASEAQSGQIFVSEATYQLTRHAFSFRMLPPRAIKGKAEPVPIYELQGRRRQRGMNRGLEGLRAPLVGRERELATFDGAVARLEQGVGGFVAVTGAAGAGKTRLLGEARAATERRTVRWVEAACASLGLGGTLGVWADAIRRLLGTEASRSRRSVTSRLSITTGTVSVAEVRDASASLAQLLNLDLSPADRRRLGDMDEDAFRHRLFVAVRELIEGEAARAPLVLVLDDLHWCDSASLALLRFVLEATARVPLLVVTAFRSDAEVRGALEEAVAHAAPPFRVDIELQPLTPDHSAALAEALVGGDPALAEVRALLVNYAEGNPFFLEEVLRSLIDQGVLRLQGGTFILSQERGELVLPPTLQGLLVDRIDRLPETSKRLVQIAAVIGRTFPPALLGQIGGVGAEITPLLRTLEEAGFFERVGGAGGDYRFRNALMQEAAYASLLLRHRRDYHRRVAEWYERQQSRPQPPAQLATILAHHWERAEDWAKAGVWGLRAGDEARRAVALHEAQEYYTRARRFGERAADLDVQRLALQGLGEIASATGAPTAFDHFAAALELAREPLDRAYLERRVGEVLGQEGQWGGALAAFTRAGELLGEERPGERPEWAAERARLRLAVAALHLRRGNPEQAHAAAEAALGAELPAPDRAEAHRLLGDVFLLRGAADQAAVHFQEALGLARSSGDLVRTAVMQERLANAAMRRRRFEEARGYLDDSLGIRRRLGDHANSGLLLLDLAALDEQAGALSQAAERLRQAVEHARAADEPVVAAQARLRLGRVLRILGDWPGARAVLERAGGDDPEMAGRAALELALLAVDRGEQPEAALRQALAQGVRFGIPDLAAYARIGLATIARRRGQREEARGYLREVLRAAGGWENEATTMALIGLAELAAEDGRADLAITSGRLALEAAERTGPASLVWRARRKLGVALAGAGRWDEAEKQLRIATEAARAARAYPELARCLGEWAGVRSRGRATPDPMTQALLAEMRSVLNAFAGRGASPAPAGAAPAAPSAEAG